MNLEMILRIVVTGAAATLCMDGWALLLRRFCGITSLDYALPGRWILWMFKGKVIHRTIISTSPLTGEKLTGWIFHYVTGMAFAFIPLLLSGPQWINAPDFGTAAATGLLTLAAPFFIMQPALGFGLAASRTANPQKARLMSLLTHFVFGCGLYLSAVGLRSFTL
ncbi:DUF2938 domain-containing protein [Pantoea sp. FN060301]|uniref:DUF2938 domain-containing protein n=1 Tax=Pantoea sp. FN060301 TaxID=3420380 RepID=UPI003D17555F